MIVAAAVPTVVLSLRLAKQLVNLEDFLRVRAWGRKNGVQGEWLSMKKCFARELRIKGYRPPIRQPPNEGRAIFDPTRIGCAIIARR